jgi:hypothetical protein
MNRALQVQSDGSFVLRGDRCYRLLLVINGPTTCAAVEAALTRGGFENPMCSAPQDWEAGEKPEKPRDWPKEPLLSTAANECLVRMSGALRTSGVPAVAFHRDSAIEPGATFTIAAAWDYCDAPRVEQRAGAAAPAPAVSAAAGTAAAKSASPNGAKFFGAAAIGLAGWGIWRLLGQSRKNERDEERYVKLRAESDMTALRTRAQHLVDQGYSEPDAEERAAREIAAQEARDLVAELEG